MTAENTIAEKRNQADAEKKKLDDIQLKPAGLEAKIAQLQQRKADLEAALAQVNQEIQTARTELEAIGYRATACGYGIGHQGNDGSG